MGTEYSPEELAQVEQWASLFFSEKEINIMLGRGLDDETAFNIHYMRGKLLSEALIRESIVSMAKNGSGPAQTEALKLINQLKIQEML